MKYKEEKQKGREGKKKEIGGEGGIWKLQNGRIRDWKKNNKNGKRRKNKEALLLTTISLYKTVI